MPQLLKNIVTPAAPQSYAPAWFEEILAGAFRAVGRQYGPLVNVRLANRIASANEPDEIDELSGFDLLISKLRYLKSKHFVFDISQVTEIDHAALQHFLGAKLMLENGGGTVVLTGSPLSDDTLLSELLTHFPHFSNPEDAIRYLELTNPDMKNHSPEGNTETGDGDSASTGKGSTSWEVKEDEIFEYYPLAGL